MAEEYKPIWVEVMRDLFFTTHCHTCGDVMNFTDTYGGSCCKQCWKWNDCVYGGTEKGCLQCINEKTDSGLSRPSMVNPHRIRDYYGINPMGSGNKFPTSEWINSNKQ